MKFPTLIKDRKRKHEEKRLCSFARGMNKGKESIEKEKQIGHCICDDEGEEETQSDCSHLRVLYSVGATYTVNSN